jgi:hypothetical protein
MSFSFSRLQVCLITVMVVSSGVLVCSAQTGGKERGWPIEYSTPKGDEAGTNLIQFPSKKDSLKQLGEDFYQPPQSLAPPSSLDGVVARPIRPPAGPMIQNKRVKELLERRKNWIFMNPEDLMSGPTVDEILKTPQYGTDGQEKKESPIFERFYRNLATKRPGPNNLLPTKKDDLFGPSSKSIPGNEVATRDDSDLPDGIKERAEALQKLYQPGGNDSPFSQSTVHGNFLDTFGLAVKELTKEELQEQKRYRDEYHSVVDPSWRPPVAGASSNPLTTVADTGLPAWKPATGLPSSPSSTPHKEIEAKLDVSNPILGPPGLPDVNARAIGETKSAPALTQLVPTRVAPLAPTFAAPKRSFR